MARTTNKPKLEIRRFQTGEKKLEAVMAEALMWLVAHHPHEEKKSSHTFVIEKNGGYNQNDEECRRIDDHAEPENSYILPLV